ncbi:MAG: prepilin peptidase [bacterium]
MNNIEIIISIVLVIFIFVFGLIWGSFMNAFLYRTKNNISLVNKRSFCPNCKGKISWYDNIPLLSYILLRGKCRHCKKKISIQYPIVELFLGLISILVAYITLPHPFSNIYTVSNPLVNILSYLFIFFLAFFIIYFCIYDILYLEINDKVAFLVIGLLLATNLVAIKFPFVIHTLIFNMHFGLGNIITGIIGLALIAIVILLSKGKMGGGDLRFIVIVGLICGLQNFYFTFLSSVVIGSVIGIILGLIKGKIKGLALPFIPFLSLGLLCGLIWGQLIWSKLFFFWGT